MISPEDKILKRENLKEILGKEKRGNKKLVLANGCFDIIHIGHIRYLREAKKEGDILLVAVNSDNSVKRIKGQNRPIINERERAFIIASFKCVDYVVIFEEERVDKIIEEIRPDVHCKGGDYTEESVPEKETVTSYGGKVKIVGGEKLNSSSNIIKKLLDSNST